MHLEISRQVFENAHIKFYENPFSVGTELLHAGGRTDGRRHFEVTFRNFMNAPKNSTKRRRG